MLPTAVAVRVHSLVVVNFDNVKRVAMCDTHPHGPEFMGEKPFVDYWVPWQGARGRGEVAPRAHSTCGMRLERLGFSLFTVELQLKAQVLQAVVLLVLSGPCRVAAGETTGFSRAKVEGGKRGVREGQGATWLQGPGCRHGCRGQDADMAAGARMPAFPIRRIVCVWRGVATR